MSEPVKINKYGQLEIDIEELVKLEFILLQQAAECNGMPDAREECNPPKSE